MLAFFYLSSDKETPAVSRNTRDTGKRNGLSPSLSLSRGRQERESPGQIFPTPRNTHTATSGKAGDGRDTSKREAPMALAESFANPEPREASVPCAIYAARGTFTGDDLTTFDRVLKDRTIAGTVIARVLRGHGLRVNAASVQRHRRGDCCCDPS